jgi:hypothetical protein
MAPAHLRAPYWFDVGQVGYNRDGIYVTWVAICSEEVASNDQVQSSAMIYAFPKWAVYGVRNSTETSSWPCGRVKKLLLFCGSCAGARPTLNPQMGEPPRRKDTP